MVLFLTIISLVFKEYYKLNSIIILKIKCCHMNYVQAFL